MDDTQNLMNELREIGRRLSVVEEVLTGLVEERATTTPLSKPAPSPAVAPPSARMSSEEAIAQVRAEAARAAGHAAVPEWSPAQMAATKATRAQKLRESAAKAKLSSVNWLGAISVICFVVAALFMIKLAIDSGWLTPARQIGMAALFGVSLIAAGLHFLRFDRGYASLLPGAGIIVLYLTAVAARSYHHLIGFEAALASVALISAITIWLYTVIRHEVYPVTAALGAYIAPFLLGGEPSQFEFILYYHIAVSITFATISIWLESRLLSVLAAYLAVGITFVISNNAPFNQIYITLLLAHFAIFAFAVVIHSVQTKRPMTAQDAWSYFPVLLVFYGAEYALISKIDPALASYVSLGFAIVLIALYFAAKAGLKKESLESASVVSAYASVVLFHAFYLELLPDLYKPWLLPILVLAVAFRPSSSRSNGFTKSQLIPVLALGAVITIEYFKTIFALVDGHADLSQTLVSFLAPISLAVLFFQERKTRASNELLPLLFAAHILAILALYNIGKEFGSLAVSGYWLAYAVVIMGAGFAIRDKVVAKSALATLGLAAAKALLYDASMAPALVRIVCLLVTGFVLYGCGYLLKRIESWDSSLNS